MSETSFPVFVLSGPSGAGKTSLWTAVSEQLPWLYPAVSHTTRPAREGEKDGHEYHFVTRSIFEKMVEQKQFLEWAEVHGHLYGSAVQNLDKGGPERGLLFEVDYKGAQQIREKLKNVMMIFVMTPSFDDLVNRIKNRGRISEQELSVRLSTARAELQHVLAFDYLVINDDYDKAANELRCIFTAERCRREYRTKEYLDLWTREIQLSQQNQAG